MNGNIKKIVHGSPNLLYIIKVSAPFEYCFITENLHLHSPIILFFFNEKKKYVVVREKKNSSICFLAVHMMGQKWATRLARGHGMILLGPIIVLFSVLGAWFGLCFPEISCDERFSGREI